MRPSRRVRIAGAVLLAAVATAPLAVTQNRAAAILCAGLILMLVWPALRGLAFGKGPDAVRCIEWSGAGDWRIVLGSGEVPQVNLHGASGIFGSWLLLRWSVDGRQVATLMDSRSAPVDVFRLLRGRLRLGAHRQGTGTADLPAATDKLFTLRRGKRGKPDE